jgi:hypothetical protein
MKESVCSSCSSLYWGLFDNGFRRVEKGAECELKGHRFATWAEVVKAVEEATVYWDKHRHPSIWGRRRRQRPRRKSGIAAKLLGFTGLYFEVLLK